MRRVQAGVIVTAPVRCRIGLLALFQDGDIAGELVPRVLERELDRRVPGVVTTRLRPDPRRELPQGPEGELDCLVAFGVLEGDAPDHLEQYRGPAPVVLTAVRVPADLPAKPVFSDMGAVSAVDTPSGDRLRAAGVTDVALVPDPVILLPRLLPRKDVEERLRELGAGELVPRQTLVVQGGPEAAPFAAALAEALAPVRGDRTVVAVEAVPGDSGFAEALSDRLPGVIRVGRDAPEDAVAAVASSAGFVGTSARLALAAFAYGRPLVALPWSDPEEIEALAQALNRPECVARGPEEVPRRLVDATERTAEIDLLSALQDRLDAHLDVVARAAVERVDRRIGDVRTGDDAGTLRAAYEARGRLLAAQRWAMADRVDGLRTENEALREKIFWLEDQLANRTGELDRMRNMAVMRFARGVRGLFRIILRRR